MQHCKTYVGVDVWCLNCLLKASTFNVVGFKYFLFCSLARDCHSVFGRESFSLGFSFFRIEWEASVLWRVWDRGCSVWKNAHALPRRHMRQYRDESTRYLWNWEWNARFPKSVWVSLACDVLVCFYVDNLMKTAWENRIQMWTFISLFQVWGPFCVKLSKMVPTLEAVIRVPHLCFDKMASSLSLSEIPWDLLSFTQEIERMKALGGRIPGLTPAEGCESFPARLGMNVSGAQCLSAWTNPLLYLSVNGVHAGSTLTLAKHCNSHFTDTLQQSPFNWRVRLPHT